MREKYLGSLHKVCKNMLTHFVCILKFLRIAASEVVTKILIVHEVRTEGSRDGRIYGRKDLRTVGSTDGRI